MLGRAADQAYLIVGKLNTQYSPEEKIKEVHPNLPIGVETNYVGFEKKKDEKIEEPIVVILYFPSTSHFFSPFVQAHDDLVKLYNSAVQDMTIS